MQGTGKTLTQMSANSCQYLSLDFCFQDWEALHISAGIETSWYWITLKWICSMRMEVHFAEYALYSLLKDFIQHLNQAPISSQQNHQEKHPLQFSI